MAYQQLAELYRAVRCYGNFFHPSMKRQAKRRDGSRVQRTYDAAQTPLQRLLALGGVAEDAQVHLLRVYAARVRSAGWCSCKPCKMPAGVMRYAVSLQRLAIRGHPPP